MRSRAGFTLVEMLIASMVVAVALAALATASVAMQRSLFAVRGYSAALSTQTRLADYVRRDLRNALDVAVQNAGAKLQIDLPADYDVLGNPVDPTIGADQSVIYGVSGARVQAWYYLSGTNFVRESGGATVVVAEDVADFQPNFTALTTAGKLTGVRLELTYAGRFGAGAASDANGREATRLTTDLALRNNPAPLPGGSTPPPVVVAAKRKGR